MPPRRSSTLFVSPELCGRVRSYRRLRVAKSVCGEIFRAFAPFLFAPLAALYASLALRPAVALLLNALVRLACATLARPRVRNEPVVVTNDLLRFRPPPELALLLPLRLPPLELPPPPANRPRESRL